MKLEELEPKTISLSVENIPINVSGLTIVFRPWTLADDIRLERDFGGPEELKKIFEGFDFHVISKIAWYQLTLASQKLVIEKVAASSLDPDTGVEVEMTITPLDKFRYLFSGIMDQTRLLTTLVRSKGINLPDIGSVDDLKKWQDQLSLET